MWPLNNYRNNIAAISDDGQKLTYEYLIQFSKKITKIISQRSLIFCLTENSIGSLLGYTSFIQNKIVPLLLDSKINHINLMGLIEEYKPDYIWIPEYLVNEFRKYEAIFFSHNYVLLKTNFICEYPLYSELALLLTTSGSTGSKKLVRISYLNLSSNMLAIADYLSIDEFQTTITTLPMNYSYGLSIINSFLSRGACIVLTKSSIMEKIFWNKFIDHKISTFSGVPYIYQMLNRLNFYSMELPSLISFTQAGGKLSSDLHLKFANYAIASNKKFIVMYGQAEATARISYLPPENCLSKIGSIGIPIPGGELYLLNNDGCKINAPNIVGELIYEGKNVSLGLAKSGKDLIKEDENFGKLYTGDLAIKDSDGFFYIIGRKNRFIKIFSIRINLDEIEEILKIKYPDKEIICDGDDDLLFIYVNTPHDFNETINFLSNFTGLHRSAFKGVTVPEIPRNETGKIIYNNLPR